MANDGPGCRPSLTIFCAAWNPGLLLLPPGLTQAPRHWMDMTCTQGRLHTHKQKPPCLHNSFLSQTSLTLRRLRNREFARLPVPGHNIPPFWLRLSHAFSPPSASAPPSPSQLPRRPGKKAWGPAADDRSSQLALPDQEQKSREKGKQDRVVWG